LKNEIELYLQRNGPSLTTDVAAHIMRTANVSSSTARQRVSRRPSDTIKTLAYLPFPRNARFIYLVQDYGSPTFWRNLIAAFENTGSIYGATLGAVIARDGIVPEAHFNIICGAPIRQKKHVAAETVLIRLLEAKLLERQNIEGIGTCIVLPRGEEFTKFPAEAARARLVAEGILLSAVASWARNNGFVSYGKVQVRSRDGAPLVGTTAWDLTGPCYLNAVVPKTAKDAKPRPAFFAADVLLKKADHPAVMAFVRKCETIRHLSRVTCIQMFLADNFTRDARELLKSRGIIAATTKSLFGKEFSEALSELRSFFQTIISTSSIDIGKLDDLLSRFGDIEGASLQIRGTLFEFLAAKIARFEFRSDIVLMNRIYHDPKNPKDKAEADLTIEQGDHKLTFVECKGTAPYSSVPEEEFQKWLQKQVPRIYAATRARQEWANREIVFEFWATAPLTANSEALFEEVNAAINKNRYSLKLRFGPEISKMCEDLGDESIIKAFDKHFVRRGSAVEGAFS
jgi:hypothetical protein